MIFFVYIDWTLEDMPRAFYVGKAGLGRKHTDAAIQKMKTHKFSDEHRRRLSEAAKQRKYD